MISTLLFVLALPLAWADTDLSVQMGDEMYPADEAYGVLTYGFQGAHDFKNKMKVEASYAALYDTQDDEAETMTDDAALMVTAPPVQAWNFSAIGRKNLTMDMYLTTGGAEVSYKSRVKTTFGLYAGTATREEEKGAFKGAGLKASTPLGPVELAAGCLLGTIDDGSFRKAYVETSGGFGKLPMDWYFSVGERHFKFGGEEGSESGPGDEFVFVGGIELSLEVI